MKLIADSQGKDIIDSCHGDPECVGTIVRISAPAEVESLWRKLELSCNPSFFVTWSWIGPWARLVKKNTELYLFTAKANNSPVAMCFLTISIAERLKGLIHSKQVMLNEYLNDHCNMITQYNGMLVNDKYAKSAWNCFYECLMSWDRPWDELAMSSISQDQLEVVASACPGLSLDIDKVHKEWTVSLKPEFSDLKTLINEFKSKSRHQLRQSIRNFEKELGAITLTAAATIADAFTYFDAMGELHTKRWEKAGRAGSFANQNWVNFHKEIIRNEFSNGNILLLAIKSGATDIGFLYGHIYKNVAYMQQTGFAAMELNILKPGYISHLYAMAFCAARGIEAYNLLPDEDSSYKRFFTAPGDSIFWVNFQKNNPKMRLEKYIRSVLGVIKNILGSYKTAR